mgnify:CR=1 FL=1
MMKIKKIHLYFIKIPLIKPYKLSFATIRELESCIVQIILDDNRNSVAEAVALPGYAEETSSDIFRWLTEIKSILKNRSLLEARNIVRRKAKKGSFATSAILTALDLLDKNWETPEYIEIPLTGIVSSLSPSVVDDIQHFIDQGYSTIKVKVGRDVQRDIDTVQSILPMYSSSIKFRFDANQAYEIDSAKRFLESIDENYRHCVELVEQPLKTDAWEEMAELVDFSPVNLMLDESIFDMEDIEKAADIHVDYVKLKLYKHAGLTELIELAENATKLGLYVVLGNGVSTDIGNLIEGFAYFIGNSYFTGASEGNGFLKIGRNLLTHPPQMRNGNLIWCIPENRKKIYEFSTI